MPSLLPLFPVHLPQPCRQPSSLSEVTYQASLSSPLPLPWTPILCGASFSVAQSSALGWCLLPTCSSQIHPSSNGHQSKHSKCKSDHASQPCLNPSEAPRCLRAESKLLSSARALPAPPAPGSQSGSCSRHLLPLSFLRPALLVPFLTHPRPCSCKNYTQIFSESLE